MKQYEIAGALALGVPPREIAEALGVSLGYVYKISRRERAVARRVAAILREAR